MGNAKATNYSFHYPDQIKIITQQWLTLTLKEISNLKQMLLCILCIKSIIIHTSDNDHLTIYNKPTC